MVRQPAAVAGSILREVLGEGPGGGVFTGQTRPWHAIDSVLISEDLGARPGTGHPLADGTGPGGGMLPHGPGLPNGGAPHPTGSEQLVSGLRTLVNGVRRIAARHLPGGVAVDEFGFDPEFNSRVLIPIARFFYQ